MNITARYPYMHLTLFTVQKNNYQSRFKKKQVFKKPNHVGFIGF